MLRGTRRRPTSSMPNSWRPGGVARRLALHACLAGRSSIQARFGSGAGVASLAKTAVDGTAESVKSRESVLRMAVVGPWQPAATQRRSTDLLSGDACSAPDSEREVPLSCSAPGERSDSRVTARLLAVVIPLVGRTNRFSGALVDGARSDLYLSRWARRSLGRAWRGRRPRVGPQVVPGWLATRELREPRERSISRRSCSARRRSGSDRAPTGEPRRARQAPS
jgi:hypothetical protein